MLPNQVTQQNNIPPPSSLQSVLQMDPNQHLQLQQQQQQQQQQPPPQAPPQQPPKRRKRAEGTEDDPPAASEPRRLRRSHEACARCRSKKIKCDSKHPRCTACATAGTPCNQEDRHRRTLTPRGYTERLELQLAQCDALLKSHYAGFTLDTLDEIIAREGIEVGGIPPSPNPNFQLDPGMRSFRPPEGGPPQQPPKGYQPPMFAPMIHPSYGPHPMMSPYGPAPPYHHQMIQGPPPPGAYNPHIHPAFQPGVPYPQGPPPPMHQHPPPPDQGVHPHQPPQPPPPLSPVMRATKGTDPNGHDMSSARALATNFGVSSAITSGLKLDAGSEEIPVDTNALPKLAVHGPREAEHWISVSVPRNKAGGGPNVLSLYGPISKSPQVEIWLPKDRSFARHIVEIYFKHLNIHRPVFARKDFEKILDDLYEGVTSFYDPGHVCSIYLIFALGTLCELNHRAVAKSPETDQFLGSAVSKKLMPANWPEHVEFFERALATKPDLYVAISSLQALILLYWYLYIERQGRTLWRLVGSLVRLSIELGLHHDPTVQMAAGTNLHIFTEEESQLRIRLWSIVLAQDRGTSILLGRPLAIAPSDTNTPQPTRAKNKNFVEFSEHFELSPAVADIQADIINSMYAPSMQSGDTIMRNATRIIKSMAAFRNNLPEKYQYYFTGTDNWSTEKKAKLVHDISEDLGLTLLKIGIARILMLRALFNSNELSYDQKHKALVDAIITSHNIIILHNQLIQFPNIAFFTSPIPLHIAAMVILYGHISEVQCLPPATAVNDVFLALDMIPKFRWRWERKDANGGHPLIAKLVEHVMKVNLHSFVPEQKPPYLIPELDWDETKSPSIKSQHGTPTLTSAAGGYGSGPGGSGGLYKSQHRPLNALTNPMHRSGSGNGGSSSAHPDATKLVDMPSNLFYPFFPEAQVPVSNPGMNVPTILKSVAAAQDGYDGAQGYPTGRNTASGEQDMDWMTPMHPPRSYSS